MPGYTIAVLEIVKDLSPPGAGDMLVNISDRQLVLAQAKADGSKTVVCVARRRLARKPYLLGIQSLLFERMSWPVAKRMAALLHFIASSRVEEYMVLFKETMMRGVRTPTEERR